MMALRFSFMPPILFTYVTAVVLSINARMCTLHIELQKNWSVKYTARSLIGTFILWPSATCGVIFINSAPTCHRCIWANHNWGIFYTQWSFANFYIIDPPFEIFFILFIKKEFSMIIPAVFAQLFVFFAMWSLSWII
jgi:hypothetical protein